MKLFPCCKSELIVFILTILYFGVISTIFLILRDNQLAPYMLGYDTAAHLFAEQKSIDFQHLISWDIRHPFLNLFFLPAITIDYFFSLLQYNFRWEIFVYYSVLILSCAGFVLFKLLKFVCTPQWTAYMLISLFYSFAHIIILSIQVDSFVFTMLFLIILIYFYATKCQGYLIDNLLFACLTGVTSTNFVKFFIFVFYTTKPRQVRQIIIRFFSSLYIFISFFILTIFDLCSRFFIQKYGLKYSFLAQTLDYRGTSINRFSLFWNNFISEPLMFHYRYNLIYAKDSTVLPTLCLYEQIPVIVLISLTILSVIKCRKHRIAKLCVMWFGLDILIHFVIGYGIEEGQIFCAHWFFSIPILIGLYLNSIINKRLYYIICGCIVLITIVLFVYNFNCYMMSVFGNQ